MNIIIAFLGGLIGGIISTGLWSIYRQNLIDRQPKTTSDELIDCFIKDYSSVGMFSNPNQFDKAAGKLVTRYFDLFYAHRRK
jgi:hypothetical protein